MSEQAETSIGRLKKAIVAATGSSITDAEIIGILKGEIPLDRPTAAVLVETDYDPLKEIGTELDIPYAQVFNTWVTARCLGVTTPEELKDHPEVVRRRTGLIWPPDKPFPLTPLEAWYVMRGWEVAPVAGITMQQIIEELPGKIEGGNGWLKLWQP